MSNGTTQSGQKGEWQELIRPLEGNTELAYLETQINACGATGKDVAQQRKMSGALEGYGAVQKDPGRQ